MFLPQTIFSRTSHVGFSITPNAVRAVVTNPAKKVIAKAEQIADQLLINGESINIPKLTQLLIQVKQDIGLEDIYAACCFPEKLSYSREHTLPSLTHAEISQAVTWQLESIFPFKREDLYFDWKLLAQTKDQVRIVISATGKPIIDGLVASCNAAGIKPLSFESSASALSRSLTEIPPNAIIVEIDNFGSSITLVENGISSLTATTNFSQTSDAQASMNEIALVISQLQERIQKKEIPIFVTGEKATTGVVSVLSQSLGQSINQLETAEVPSAFQTAYVESIATIQAPESSQTINLLPNTIEKFYQQETDVSQAKVVAKYGLVISLTACISSLAILLFAFILEQESIRALAATPEPPSSPAEIDLSLYLQKAQKITKLQSLEYFPTQHIDAIISTTNDTEIKQLSYDASKNTVKITLGTMNRNRLFEIRENLDSTELFDQISVPLSALNTDQSDNIPINLKLRK